MDRQDSPSQDGQKTTMKQWLVSLSATSGAICIGASLTLPGVLIPALQVEENSSLKITLQEGSWLVAILVASAILGSLVGGLCADLLGRKFMLILSQIPFIISWIIIGQAEDLVVIYLGRILSGGANGMMFSILPVYISEICSPDERGVLMNLINISQNIGILLIYFLGAFLPWRSVCWAMSLPNVVSALAMILFMPETPYFLASAGNIEKAKKSLLILRGKDCNIQADLEDINDRITADAATMRINTFIKLQNIGQTLCSSSFLRPFSIVALCYVTTQSSGVLVISQFLVNIFQESGITVDPYKASVGAILLKLIASNLAMLMVKLFSRRALFLQSGLIIAMFMLVFGVASYLNTRIEPTNHDIGLSYNNVNATYLSTDVVLQTWFKPVLDWTIFISLSGTQFFYSAGYEAVLRLQCGEMSPTKVRSLASGTILVVSNLNNSVACYLFPPMLKTLHLWGTFVTYSLIMMFGTIACFLLLPESKGKSLADMERHFESQRKNERN